VQTARQNEDYLLVMVSLFMTTLRRPVRLLIAVFLFACGCAALLAGAFLAHVQTGGVMTMLVFSLAVLLGSFSLSWDF
jgi:hypothetical protein